jgi:DNA mismatch endonuclease (patch repair protein)
MDNVSPEVRSRTMAAVHSSGTRSTERALRARLAQAAFRGWRTNAKDLRGCPDFVFDQQRVVVFVDGCFWHGCPVCCRMPGSNKAYWNSKVARNQARDRKVRAGLRRDGWRVIRIWEHELQECPDSALDKIGTAIARV